MKKGGRGTRKEWLLVEFQALSARNSYIRHLIETAEKKAKEDEIRSLIAGRGLKRICLEFLLSKANE